jgi:hypothetical protein
MAAVFKQISPDQTSFGLRMHGKEALDMEFSTATVS